MSTPRFSRLHNRVVRARWLGALVAGAVMLAGALAHDAAAQTDLLTDSTWPMYGHDPKHTFRSCPANVTACDEAAIGSRSFGPTTNNLLALTPIGNIIYSEAAVTLDGVFIFGAGYTTYGVRADGPLIWKSRVGAEASFSSPALDTDGFLYIGGRDNQLWKKNTHDGSAVCKYYINTDGDIKSSPTISAKYRDRVYVTSDRHVYAIATRRTTVNGKPFDPCTLIWRYPAADVLNGVVFSSVSVADSTPGNGDSLGNLVVAAGSYVYMFRDDGDHASDVGANGSMKKAKIGAVSGPTPLIHPTTGNIYIGTQDKKLYGFTPGLAPLAHFPVNLGSKIWSSASLSRDGQKLYVPTDDGKLHAIDVATGLEAVGFPYAPAGNRFTAKGYAAVVDAAGNIYFAGQDRFVRALKPNGSLLWQSAQPMGAKGAPATIVDGGLIVPSWDHNLYRFCPNPVGPPTALDVCGFTIDTTAP